MKFTESFELKNARIAKNLFQLREIQRFLLVVRSLRTRICANAAKKFLQEVEHEKPDFGDSTFSWSHSERLCVSRWRGGGHFSDRRGLRNKRAPPDGETGVRL